MKLEIITKESPRWAEFIKALDGKLVRWSCLGNLDLAAAILVRMPNVDTKGTLAYLRSRGGHCDCEVMMNVDCGGEGA